jgi:hypothetical protein
VEVKTCKLLRRLAIIYSATRRWLIMAQHISIVSLKTIQ